MQKKFEKFISSADLPVFYAGQVNKSSTGSMAGSSLLLLVDLGAPRRPLLSASTSLRAFAARNAKKRKERKKGTKKQKLNLRNLIL